MFHLHNFSYVKMDHKVISQQIAEVLSFDIELSLSGNPCTQSVPLLPNRSQYATQNAQDLKKNCREKQHPTKLWQNREHWFEQFVRLMCYLAPPVRPEEVLLVGSSGGPRRGEDHGGPRAAAAAPTPLFLQVNEFFALLTRLVMRGDSFRSVAGDEKVSRGAAGNKKGDDEELVFAQAGTLLNHNLRGRAGGHRGGISTTTKNSSVTTSNSGEKHDVDQHGGDDASTGSLEALLTEDPLWSGESLGVSDSFASAGAWARYQLPDPTGLSPPDVAENLMWTEAQPGCSFWDTKPYAFASSSLADVFQMFPEYFALALVEDERQIDRVQLAGDVSSVENNGSLFGTDRSSAFRESKILRRGTARKNKLFEEAEKLKVPVVEEPRLYVRVRHTAFMEMASGVFPRCLGIVGLKNIPFLPLFWNELVTERNEALREKFPAVEKIEREAAEAVQEKSAAGGVLCGKNEEQKSSSSRAAASEDAGVEEEKALTVGVDRSDSEVLPEPGWIVQSLPIVLGRGEFSTPDAILNVYAADMCDRQTKDKARPGVFFDVDVVVLVSTPPERKPRMMRRCEQAAEQDHAPSIEELWRPAQAGRAPLEENSPSSNVPANVFEIQTLMTSSNREAEWALTLWTGPSAAGSDVLVGGVAGEDVDGETYLQYSTTRNYEDSAVTDQASPKKKKKRKKAASKKAVEVDCPPTMEEECVGGNGPSATTRPLSEQHPALSSADSSSPDEEDPPLPYFRAYLVNRKLEALLESLARTLGDQILSLRVRASDPDNYSNISQANIFAKYLSPPDLERLFYLSKNFLEREFLPHVPNLSFLTWDLPHSFDDGTFAALVRHTPLLQELHMDRIPGSPSSGAPSTGGTSGGGSSVTSGGPSPPRNHVGGFTGKTAELLTGMSPNCWRLHKLRIQIPALLTLYAKEMTRNRMKHGSSLPLARLKKLSVAGHDEFLNAR